MGQKQEDSKESSTKDKIEYCLEESSKLEKENKITEAIQSLREAIALLNSDNIRNMALSLYFRIGDLYQISGDIEEGLKYYISAYSLSLKLNEKTFQIDALIKITNSFVNKGEADQGIKYAKQAQEILKSFTYVEGKINLNISLARLYYMQKDHYKARDICNEALRLCSEEHILYKGIILNLMAELYKDMTSVEEHLEILNQAYKHFEKAGYLRGEIGVLNNFANIYSDKLQDYSKALEYLIRVKELSEISIYKEFIGIAFMNIGEVCYKLLRYEEAQEWLTQALSKPHGPYIDNSILYCLTFLIQTSLKLGMHKEANNYFVQANEQIKKYQHRESTLIHYYKAAAFMYYELDDINMAKTYIKKALSLVEKDNSMVKWYIGLLYEQIRLKEVKNMADITVILEAARYTLSKYKNKEEILDSVCDLTIELIKKGDISLALEFFHSYDYLNSENPVVKEKMQYIKAGQYNS